MTWPNSLKVVGQNKDGSYKLLCCAHEDNQASLSLFRGKKRWFLKCHAGCSWERVMSAAGITQDELQVLMGEEVAAPFDIAAQVKYEKHKSEKKAKRVIAHTFDYTDEDGNLLFQVCRTEPKGFFQRRPDGVGGWLGDTKGVRKTIYRLPRIVRLLAGSLVLVTEGELCVHAAEELGFCATTSPGGSSAWRDEYSIPLRIHRVAVLYDNDAPGIKYGCSVVASLRKYTHAEMIHLPGLPDRGDLVDWVKMGNGKKELTALLRKEGLL